MLINPILTIAVPTFNRQESLKRMLLSLAPLRNISDVQVLVIDNFSNDGTWEWLCENGTGLGLTIQQNHANIGIEGNIIQTLLQAKGDYIWLLSDHMGIEAKEIQTFIVHLKKGLEFTFGYARIAQYKGVLPATYSRVRLSDVNQYSLGELIFYMGNISAFIVNKCFLYKCFRTVFRFSSFSYPHLGVFAHADENSTFIELPIMSSFIYDSEKPKRISYDTFRSRFIGFVRAIEEIRRLNPNLKYINKSLNTHMLLGALVHDSILMLSFERDNPIKPSEFAFCLWHYPRLIKLFLLLCLSLSALPQKVRRLFSKAFFNTFTPKQFKKAEASNHQRVFNETIIE